jgi:deazaflavin-dependent oxidoreductase (nitroreductase family)
MSALNAVTLAAFSLFGKWVRFSGQPIIRLTTVGARSGKRRQTLLVGFPDGEDRWLIAASARGSARHPAWYFNLARHPDQAVLEIQGRKIPVRAESLKGAERDAAWQRIIARSPGFRSYQEETDRVIPVVVLTPIAAS